MSTVQKWLSRELVLAERRLAAALRDTTKRTGAVCAYGRRDKAHEDIAVIRRLLRRAK